MESVASGGCQLVLGSAQNSVERGRGEPGARAHVAQTPGPHMHTHQTSLPQHRLKDKLAGISRHWKQSPSAERAWRACLGLTPLELALLLVGSLHGTAEGKGLGTALLSGAP